MKPNQKTLQGGFALVEVMVAMGVLAIATFGMLELHKSMAQQMNRSAFMYTLQDLTQQTRNALQGHVGWKTTIQNNASMECLKNATSCSARTAFAPFDLYLPGNSLLFKGTGTTEGFTSVGNKCNVYSSTGSAACPLRLSLQWKAVCDTLGIDPTCLAPGVIVEVKFLYSPTPETEIKPLNIERFNFTHNVQTNIDLLKRMCEGMGGVFDAITFECNLSAVRNEINMATTNSNNAVSIANNSSAIANGAVNIANTAQNRAGDAVNIANTANENSNSAVNISNEARTISSVANNTSNTAIEIARRSGGGFQIIGVLGPRQVSENDFGLPACPEYVQSSNHNPCSPIGSGCQKRSGGSWIFMSCEPQVPTQTTAGGDGTEG